MNTATTGRFNVFVEHGLRAARCSEQRAALYCSFRHFSHDEMNNNYRASRSMDLFRTGNLPRRKQYNLERDLQEKME